MACRRGSDASTTPIHRSGLFRKEAWLSFTALIAIAGPAWPQDSYPRFDGDVVFRFAYDNDYTAEDPRIEAVDVAFKMEARPNLHFSDRFRLDAEIRLENTGPPSENRTFEDQALFVRKLFLELDVTDQLTVFGGKITPSFAFFSLNIPGMYGNDYSKEIELIERIGLGADYALDGGALGQHIFSATTFFEDTTFLSNSAIRSRGQTRRADGGASNTESFESFTVAIEGRAIEALPGLTYKLAYVHEAKGVGDVADENGVLVAAKQRLSFENGDRLDLIAEAASLSSFEGSGDDLLYISGGFSYATDPWRLTVSGTYRPRDLGADGTYDDYSIQTALSYSIAPSWSVEIAHKFTADQDLKGNRIGLRLNKTLDLSRR